MDSDFSEETSTRSSTGRLTGFKSVIVLGGLEEDLEVLLNSISASLEMITPRINMEVVNFPNKQNMAGPEGKNEFEVSNEKYNDLIDTMFSTVSEKLEKDLDIHLVIVYSDPVIHLAESIAQAVSIKKCIDEWMINVEKMLKVCRGYGRRVTLLNGHAALGDTDGFALQMRQRFGSAVKIPVGSLVQEFPTNQKYLFLLASNALDFSSDAKNLFSELQARSLPIDRLKIFDFQGFISDARLYIDSADVAILENQKLIESWHLALEELEPYLLRESAVQDSLKLGKKREQELSRLRREYANLQELFDGKCEQVEAIYASRSWRITAPLRRILDAINV